MGGIREGRGLKGEGCEGEWEEFYVLGYGFQRM